MLDAAGEAYLSIPRIGSIFYLSIPEIIFVLGLNMIIDFLVVLKSVYKYIQHFWQFFHLF